MEGRRRKGLDITILNKTKREIAEDTRRWKNLSHSQIGNSVLPEFKCHSYQK